MHFPFDGLHECGLVTKKGETEATNPENASAKEG